MAFRASAAAQRSVMTSADLDPHQAPGQGVDRRRLPAVTLPVAREDRRGWSVLSILLHLLVIALLLMPVAEATHEGLVIERAQSAGGAGPAGGGGGGHLGTGGVHETVHYVAVAPPPPTPVPTPIPPVTPPPVVPPPPKPVVVPPPEVVTPSEPVAQPKLNAKMDVAKAADLPAPTSGSGGGTGRDGSAGNGPGSGGGVGAGIGTGRGSGVGPGKGGGTQANYPPTPTDVFLPPSPIPDKVRGFHLVAEYDVDQTGKVLDFTFTPTKDGSYNKRLEEVLRGFKFRPGTKPDGTPIRMRAQIVYDLW
jgi:hypothetical protein